MLLGPWGHCCIYRDLSDFPNAHYDWAGEHLRFYDQLLKGEDTGSLSEPPVLYYTMGDVPGQEWHRSADFPVEGTTFPKLYLSAGNTLEEAPTEKGSLSYTVREDIQLYEKMGRMNRHITRDMTPEDDKSLAFTSAPLPKDLEITGVPILDLWVTSTHTDGNFIAALEWVCLLYTSLFAGFARTLRTPGRTRGPGRSRSWQSRRRSRPACLSREGGSGRIS